MYRSALKTFCTAALVAAATATASFAATFDATNVTSGSNDHTFFFGNNPFGGNKHWQFVGGKGLFETTTDGVDNFAKLTGTIFQNAPVVDGTNRFDVDVTFKQTAGPSAAGPKADGVFGSAATWTFFEFFSATLSGSAGSVNGLVLGLTDRTNQPIGQLGDGANDKNAGFGFSDWFTYTVLSNQSQTGLAIGATGVGDINLNLSLTETGDDVRLSSVPLPAGGLLLLSGMVGFGAMRKFKKS